VERLTGVGVSDGVATGRALVLRFSTLDIRFRVPTDAIVGELSRLEVARELSRAQLEDIKARIARTAAGEHAYLFDAQLLMLDDPLLVARAAELVRGARLNAEWAIQLAFEELAALLDRAEDAYLRERKGDMADVVGRLRMNLRGEAAGTADPGELARRGIGGADRCILVADELPPSVAAQLDWSRIAAFATDAGSRTYHTAILARSLRVPAIVGLRDASVRIPPGAKLLLDGTTGELAIDPPLELLQRVAETRHTSQAREQARLRSRDLPAVTLDGVAVRLLANIERAADVEQARAYGAEGVGLFRSEFLLAHPAPLPLTEEGQYETYCAILQAMAPAEVTIRTFDAGQEQVQSGRAVGEGWRERLGLRAVRLALAGDDLFRQQLRALLRAAAHGSLRIMFPFVSGVDELRAARAAVDAAAESLRADGFDPSPVPLGVMIEVPSAAVTADLLAREADFLSIGTNDLIQYTLAVDRTDPRVSHLYEPLHPAILRMLHRVSQAASRAGVRLSICGEMASDPALVMLLVGFGVEEFSMTPAAIPVIKQVIREMQAADARTFVREARRATTAAEVERRLNAFAARVPLGPS
jgi:phosphotransferase system enzyme I (PtsI)